ncbi:MAG: hypothetical protein Q7S70_01805 [bacterium]|nr:hypothetical protein [bacterium]
MIIGHQIQWQYLKRLAELDKIPHALLFSGPEKVGKRTVALEFAKLLIGESKEWHPDLILIEPEEGETKIAQIRDLIWKVSLKPYSAPFKVAVIDSADKMTREAQNCFLKTLEEPKEKTFLILIAEHSEVLLPTILSRCQIVKFHPVPKSEIEDYLKEKGLDRPKIEEVSDVASGLPGRAVEIFLEPEKLIERKKTVGELQEAMGKDLAYRFQLAKALAEKDNLREILKIWQGYLRGLVVSSFSPSPLLKKNVAILKQIQNISYLIQNTNVNRRLALEILMLEI